MASITARVGIAKHRPAAGGGGADWTPADLGFIARPSGGNYVTIESLGVGTNLRAAAVHPSAAGKILTLPNGTYSLNDYTQGDGGLFMHGLFLNNGATQIRGIVGSGAGTIIQMAPNSSHFTAETALQHYSGGTQYLVSTIQWYEVNNVEFGNLKVQGQPQPHWHHGIRINGHNAYVHHVQFIGSSYGSYNSPPGETYALMISGNNPIIEDCEFDGRRDGSTLWSSSLAGVLGCTNSIIRRCYMHDMLSGFGVVQWEGTGCTTEDVWVYRPGSGASGFNGAHTNHERGWGPVRHYRPHILLDAWWGSPRRNNGKFGHFCFWNTADAHAYVDSQIIEPVYDTWGGIAGGFAITVDTITDFPDVIKNGITRTPVVRPQWWVDSPAINTATQYWVTNVTGDASVWG